ncbi:MAG: hypothetical protein AAF721_02930 [Myxococcota bacterium]
MKIALPAALSLTLTTACGGDDGALADGDTAAETGDTSGDGTDGASAPDGTGEAPASDDGPLDPDGPRLGASGIALSDVVVNQGVAVTLAQAETMVPQEARASAVLHGRRTHVRATWTTEPGFAPRPIRAELHLVHTDGTQETLVDVRTLGALSGPAHNDFVWDVPAEAIPPGTRWRITLHEDELAPDGLVDPQAPSLPAVGDSALDDAPGDKHMRLVLVPYRHQRAGCDQPFPLDVVTVDTFTQAMEMQYPVQEVDIEVHSEVVYTGPTGDLSEFLFEVTDLRTSEFPDPEVFYFGALWPCDAPLVGGLGYTPFEPASIAGDTIRASVGAYYESNPERVASTMVHEVGHNLGRRHASCDNGEDNVDPAYPVAGAAIGSEGWGIHDELFRAPSTHDFMSYCDPAWVSAYGWGLAVDVLDQLRINVEGAGAPSRDGVGATALLVRDGAVERAVPWPGFELGRHDGSATWQRPGAADEAAPWQVEALGDSGAELVIVAGALTDPVPRTLVREGRPPLSLIPTVR